MLRTVIVMSAACLSLFPAAARSDAVLPGTIVSDYAATVAGGYSRTNVESVNLSANTGFGEAAILRRLPGNLHLQIDAALYSHDFTDVASGQGTDQWHFGGALFWRDAHLGLIGVDGGYGRISMNSLVENYRVGLRTEWYLGDRMTIAARGGYHETDSDTGTGDAWTGTVSAEYFVTSDLGLKGQADWLREEVGFAYGKQDSRAWALSAEAEYLLTGTHLPNVSLFVSVRHYDFDYSYSSDGQPLGSEDWVENQFTAGLRYYFGSSGSLVDHKRNNTVDNTHIWLERDPWFP